MDDFSLANCSSFTKFAKLSFYQTFLLYGTIFINLIESFMCSKGQIYHDSQINYVLHCLCVCTAGLPTNFTLANLVEVVKLQEQATHYNS